MNPFSDRYTIRKACLSDLAALPQIEAEAAQLFRQTPYSFVADSPPLPIAALQSHFTAGRLWVAADDFDAPVGFAIASIVANAAYIQEIDVQPQHTRQGIGTQLIENICHWAKEQNFDEIYLSNFSDVLWNAPFYSKLGFKVVPASHIRPEFHQIRHKEADSGLPIDKRVIMCRQL